MDVDLQMLKSVMRQRDDAAEERDMAVAQVEAVLDHLDTAEALGVGVGIPQLREIITVAGRSRRG